jgi:hypothetical protein
MPSLKEASMLHCGMIAPDFEAEGITSMLLSHLCPAVAPPWYQRAKRLGDRELADRSDIPFVAWNNARR